MRSLSPWQRVLLALVGLLVLTVFASVWLGSSSRSVETFDPVGAVFVVSDAGSVRIRSWSAVEDSVRAELADTVEDRIDEGGVVVRASDSWLVRRPDFESLRQGSELVVRSRCDTRFPCRSTLEVFVPDGIELTVVAASDMVQVDSFDGRLLVFAGDEGVVLGSVAGSASVVSRGPVRGSTLGPRELTVDAVDDPVQLTYLDVPDVVAVTAGAGSVTIELPSTAAYAMDIRAVDASISVDADGDSGRLVSIETEGRVVVEPTLTE